MPLNAPLQRRKPRPRLNPDAALRGAFQTVLAEGVPDRFHVLLDALSREGSDHDDIRDPRLPNPGPFNPGPPNPRLPDQSHPPAPDAEHNSPGAAGSNPPDAALRGLIGVNSKHPDPADTKATDTEARTTRGPDTGGRFPEG